MSSPAGPQPSQSRFLSRWIPSSSRAGVFLSGSPGEVSSLQSSCSSVAQEVSLDDSFCSQFAPLPVSCSSSLDSAVPKVSETDPEAEPSSSELDGVHNVLKKAQGLPLIEKLEQLKQLQQRMQEQLKVHQQEQLQKLQTEQQKLLGMVQTGAEYSQEKQPYNKTTNMLQPLQTASTLSNPQGSVPWAQITRQQEAAKALVSSMWDHQPSVEQSRSGHEVEEDAIHEEESLQSTTEDQSVHGQDSITELQDRPIRSATSGKTFEEMLEEQLKLENERLNKSILTETVKVKRPFLRRGEGLSRFTRGKAAGPSRERTAHSSTKSTLCLDPPTSQGQSTRPHHQSLEPKKPSPKSTASTNVVIQRKTAVLNKENLPQNRVVVPTKATKAAKAPVLGAHQGQNVSAGALQHLNKSYRRPDPQQKIICDAVDDVSKGKSFRHVENTVDPSAHVAENSFEVWLAERGEHWDKARQRECVELGEFELLERAADELSFSSNSSFICTLLRRDRRRLSSTPVKSPQQPTLPGHRQDNSTSPVQRSGSNVQQSLPDLPVDKVAASVKQIVVINESSEDEDKVDEVSDVSLCSSSDIHQTAFGPSQPFSHCFQVSQALPYNKHSYQDRDRAASREDEEENNGDSTLVDVKGHVDFDDDDTWNELEDLPCVSTKTNEQAGRALKRKVAVSKGAEPDASSASSLDHEPEPPPTCQLVAKLFPALKPKPSPPPPPVVQDNEQATAQSRLLRERLVELETEIERFKTENAALSRLRRENEGIRENLRKERAEFQQKMADDLTKWEEMKREENRKLQRDKKLFEKHAAAIRARPNKQERDEIQSLKQQLNTLQEDLRKREARWTSTHHRLRQQMDTLSSENTALRDQVRMMEKLRLTAWKNAECVREREKERERPAASGSSTTAQKRTQSKSPSRSIKSSSSTSNRRESPEVKNPPKAAVVSSSARSAACNSKLQNTQRQKEPCPVADPFPISDGQTAPEGSDYESNTDSSSELDSPGADTEQSQMEQEEITHVDGKIEKVLPDGGRLIVFPNGTRKELSADGLSIKVTFFNGDIKHIMPDQRVIYYYAGAQTTHTTYPDGMEVLQFPNNQIEKHFPDGRKEITFPDQTVKNLHPDGREESVLADGTIIQQNPDGSKEIQFNTGQRELHTADFKRREYPDGTVKTVYSDGRQETRYPSGRMRLKDPQGRVVMDTKT
ncbi:centromere protein J isoform X2 [Pygocentrus nattereri]|uniref:Centrosomal P4.1-associated protein n=1 Tax=Pygocentrus nattereri TaxID=42514 RepID=A0A3B4EMU9_PYGNA|nr:centromere protein J isoform X2 [Pygocentrus nattereri]